MSLVSMHMAFMRGAREHHNELDSLRGQYLGLC